MYQESSEETFEKDKLLTIDGSDIDSIIIDSEQFGLYDYSELSIHAISPNPKGNDNKEWLEIINN